MGLAAAKAPPFRLPGEHFTAAIVFLGLGAVGLIWVAPDLAAGAFPLPAVLGVTHLFTLGWMTTSIMGALYQFLPVALGEPIKSVPAGHVAFALYVPGVAVFVAGLIFADLTADAGRRSVARHRTACLHHQPGRHAAAGHRARPHLVGARRARICSCW